MTSKIFLLKIIIHVSWLTWYVLKWKWVWFYYDKNNDVEIPKTYSGEVYFTISEQVS